MCTPLIIPKAPPPTKLNSQPPEVESKQPPLSTGFPAFSILNKRRRVTCRECGTPIGYLKLDLCHIDAYRSEAGRAARKTMDDRRFGAIYIADPVNVHLNRPEAADKKLSAQQLPFGADVLENLMGQNREAEQAICDECDTCLGARITEFEAVPSPPPPPTAASPILTPTTPTVWEGVEETESVISCKPPGPRQECGRYFAFSYDAVEVEPIFGLMGMRELSIRYHGGEKYWTEVRSIEEQAETSNDSSTWILPMTRRPHQVEVAKKTTHNSWPLVHMDLVRASDLPEGIIGHRPFLDIVKDITEACYAKQRLQTHLTDKLSEEEPKQDPNCKCPEKPKKLMNCC
ncbi:unnamed protein product [Schistocephalus solidus]|uniref:HNH_5 domain-containing protein n=1 Tax=Schistocephalus solidus TaxID=70667 RepID=A0A183TF96_SCHSO|nr:unnamed protein product [Schistocephalus solidus]